MKGSKVNQIMKLVQQHFDQKNTLSRIENLQYLQDFRSNKPQTIETLQGLYLLLLNIRAEINPLQKVNAQNVFNMTSDELKQKIQEVSQSFTKMSNTKNLPFASDTLKTTYHLHVQPQAEEIDFYSDKIPPKSSTKADKHPLKGKVVAIQKNLSGKIIAISILPRTDTSIFQGNHFTIHHDEDTCYLNNDSAITATTTFSDIDTHLEDLDQETCKRITDAGKKETSTQEIKSIIFSKKQIQNEYDILTLTQFNKQLAVAYLDFCNQVDDFLIKATDKEKINAAIQQEELRKQCSEIEPLPSTNQTPIIKVQSNS